MRYIRTKENEFIEIHSKQEYEKVHPEFIDNDTFNYDKWFALVTKDIDILKVADNLNELFDNFVVEYTNGEHTMFHDFYHLQRHYELYNQSYHNVAGRYGCVWIAGKGLIYKAKMNKEGNLELI